MNMRILAFIIAFLVSGNSHAGPIDLVKTGVLDYDKSMTVGNAFDNWSNCSSTEWEEFETDRGKTVVQSICNIKDGAQFAAKVAASGVAGDSPISHLTEFVGAKAYYQWTVYADGSGFELTYVGGEYLWIAGKKAEFGVSIGLALENLFGNVKDFDLDSLNGGLVATKTAYAYHHLFSEFYRKAESARENSSAGDSSERTFQGVIVGPEEEGDPYAIKLSAPVSLPATEACDAEVRDFIFLWATKAELQSFVGKKVNVTGMIDCPRGGQVLRNIRVRTN